MVFIAKGLGDHRLLGESPDDALGEAMDKVTCSLLLEPFLSFLFFRFSSFVSLLSFLFFLLSLLQRLLA